MTPMMFRMTNAPNDRSAVSRHKLLPAGSACLIAMAVACVSPGALAAQQPGQRSNSEVSSQQPIGWTSATEVQVRGAASTDGGETFLGNGSTIKAGTQPVKISLNRGGQILLCSTTSLHLSKDQSTADPQDTALMMAFDRGALEAHYTVGKYSDVLLTPDLRILISGPGEANLSIRLNNQGDTCVDNHGANAPYVTVSSQLEGGAYRVQPNQRVTFEHGGLNEMVDRESEPCGCPTQPTVSLADAGAASRNPAHPGQPVGGPSSTPADTAFPLAESEGLAPPPRLPDKPVVPVGVAHAEVTVPMVYNGDNPPAPPSEGSATGPSGGTGSSSAAGVSTATTAASAPAPTIPSSQSPVLSTSTATTAASPAPPAPAPASKRGFFHRIGHFFTTMFGR
jgi:hypothetical protein